MWALGDARACGGQVIGSAHQVAQQVGPRNLAGLVTSRVNGRRATAGLDASAAQLCVGRVARLHAAPHERRKADV